MNWIGKALLLAPLALNLGAAETRDPAYWPFDAKSPWNHPIGSEAQYAEVKNGFYNYVDEESRKNKPGLNVGEWSINVYYATDSDPVGQTMTWYEPTPGQYIGPVNIPEEAKPSLGSDGHLTIIDPSHRYAYELGCVKRIMQDYPGGLIQGWCSFRNDLRGMGVYDQIHGTRASGVSSLGGLIRKGELKNGIHHALAIATDPTNLNSNAPGGNHFVWPASSSDMQFPGNLMPEGAHNRKNWYGKTSNLYMGSLVAIPPEVDLTQIGIQVPGPTYEIAKALQNYGGYISDMGWAPFILFAEHSVADDLEGAEAVRARTGGVGLELEKLIPYLRVVENNSRDNVGGGGTPRVPFAPDFAPEFLTENNQ